MKEGASKRQTVTILKRKPSYGLLHTLTHKRTCTHTHTHSHTNAHVHSHTLTPSLTHSHKRIRSLAHQIACVCFTHPTPCLPACLRVCFLSLQHTPHSLQTGMRGAYGKPYGKVARVSIGQPIMSVRSKDNHKAHVIEALRRTKMKFPGRQLIIVSRKWGFTRFDREEYVRLRDEGKLIPDGSHVKVFNDHGPFENWIRHMS